MGTQKHTRKHAEAFCVMQYRCEKCGQVELIYNNRDGVTPFIIESRCCNTDAQHVDWARDLYLPNYQPPKGMRIFRDGTDEEARAIMRRRVSNPEMRKQYPLTDAEANEIVERSVDDKEFGEFQRGWPMTVEMDQQKG